MNKKLQIQVTGFVLMACLLTSCATPQGKVSIYVNPKPAEEKAAQVMVDGKWVDSLWAGRRPTELTLDVGDHVIEVQAEGYKLFSKPFTINRGEQVQTLMVELERSN